jgi:ketosteroid isomerase-like protein
MCGVAISADQAAGERRSAQALARTPGPIAAETFPASPRGNETHHYHHHYHHHYFPGPEGIYPRGGADPSREVAREEKSRPNVALRGEMTRAEAAVRNSTQEWVVACNTKHLDDLVELYVPDGIVLRSNCPPIRGATAVREFFFGALGAGLGEVELEPLRVDVVGDMAYEAGRFKALVPSATGKRREERGKYLWVCQRQSNLEWKLAADCWSSDLTLSTLESDVPVGTGIKTSPVRK